MKITTLKKGKQIFKKIALHFRKGNQIPWKYEKEKQVIPRKQNKMLVKWNNVKHEKVSTMGHHWLDGDISVAWCQITFV